MKDRQEVFSNASFRTGPSAFVNRDSVMVATVQHGLWDMLGQKVCEENAKVPLKQAKLTRMYSTISFTIKFLQDLVSKSVSQSMT